MLRALGWTSTSVLDFDVLEHHEAHSPVGQAARKHIAAKYDFNSVILPRRLKMINSILPRKLHLSA